MRANEPAVLPGIELFGQATGVPVLLNTSFNLRGEPIVTTPANALNTFGNSDIDTLYMDNFVVPKVRIIKNERRFFRSMSSKCRYRWRAPEFPVAAQALVADPNSDGSVALRVAPDFCVRLWRWTIYLHPFLNRQKVSSLPQAPSPGRSLFGKLSRVLTSLPFIFSF